jgi:hypothetical protein
VCQLLKAEPAFESRQSAFESRAGFRKVPAEKLKKPAL